MEGELFAETASHDNDTPVIPEKMKRQRWDNTFKSASTDKHRFVTSSRKGSKHAFCKVCRTDICVAHGAYNDVTRHPSR